MYQLMEFQLRELQESGRLPFELHSSINAGLVKLNKYHSLAKSNQFYVVATICHPSFRLKWFGDTDSYEYKHAHTIFETVYGEYSKAGPVGLNVTSPKKNTSTSSAPPKTPPPEEEHSKFDRYISGEGGEGDIDKPLDWWWTHCKDIEGVPGFPIINHIA
ncbi:hypothetical protein F5890DRAFT_1563589 [Lentinula detonsa]|uniref:HAT C-terminal dimerisation domain-containing protein n=1 Tax=Lentinula detonsa TaxID=2804962 RepID=A0AA38Q521_9AGAR|nr:hypothetical protein F5890DRAFT_1563589 [Lentinula detonsa]